MEVERAFLNGFYRHVYRAMRGDNDEVGTNARFFDFSSTSSPSILGILISQMQRFETALFQLFETFLAIGSFIHHHDSFFEYLFEDRADLGVVFYDKDF